MADELSQETRIKIGVPQGSVIGSLIFLLFVYDLPCVITTTTSRWSHNVHKATNCRVPSTMPGIGR